MDANNLYADKFKQANFKEFTWCLSGDSFGVRFNLLGIILSWIDE